ncbi:MAG TPA: hypothetical protein VFE50_23270 [Cyclobacteriaceae bacterium]|nr:hypothetical protein [Cyclobacteriaceae bacterium]
MTRIKAFLYFLFFVVSANTLAQTTSITYELNGKAKANNPFKKFAGEWTLKNDDWNQNWGGSDEKIKIPKHHTVSTEINTDLSMISIIDGPQPNGHIFWSYDPKNKVFHHLSSFGTARSGVGKGTINEKGDLSIKIAFSDEASGTYRMYSYKWINDNEYELMSVQYNDKDKPTGLFYGGTFVRIVK